MSIQDEWCVHCVRDLVMHPPESRGLGAPIRIISPGGDVATVGRLSWNDFTELATLGGRKIEIGNIGLYLGLYAKFLVAGTPLCYGHTYIETEPASPKGLRT